MKKAELEERIKALGLPPSYYSLNGELNYGIVLDKFIEADWYRVFYRDEKGNYKLEQKFYSEDKACDYMYSLLIVQAGNLSEKVKEKYRNIYFNGNPPPAL